MHAAAAYLYVRRVSKFRGVFGLSILGDVVHAATAYLCVRRVAWFGGVFGLFILDDLVHAAAAYLYVQVRAPRGVVLRRLRLVHPRRRGARGSSV